MFFENNFLYMCPESELGSIHSYKIIINQFINKFINLYNENYIEQKLSKKKLIDDAIIYSKYYLYFKTMNCIYDEKIMEIIFNVDNF